MAHSESLHLGQGLPVRWAARFAKSPRVVPDRRNRRRKRNVVADRQFAAQKCWTRFWESSFRWRAHKRVRLGLAPREWSRRSKQTAAIHRAIANVATGVGPSAHADHKCR